MAAIRVTTQTLRSTAEQAENLALQYMSRVEDLYNTGRELDNTWKGDANKAFSTILGNDRDKFEGLKTLVDRYIENLRNDADEYDRAESVNLETLSSSTIRKK